METEAKPTNQKRYVEGREFFYDFKFASESRHSKILNDTYGEEGQDEYSLLQGRKERLRFLENDLQDHLASTKRTKQTAFNKGLKYIEDDRSRERRVTLEARIDVVKLEIHKLEEAIRELEEEKTKKEIPRCLPYGPQGSSSIRGQSQRNVHGAVTAVAGCGYLDGQWCEPVNGLVVIVDRRSGYCGLATTDYIQFVALPWKKAIRQRWAELLKEFAGREERMPARHTIVPWPPFPNDCKNHLQSETPPQKLVRSKTKKR